MEKKKTKILMIEDSLDDALLIKRKLENSTSSSFLVTSVKTLQDGLEHLANEPTDLVISDLGLPDSHGLDTVKKILKAAPHVPLVVLSGFDDESIAIKAVQAGAQDYLVKGHFESSHLERSLNYSIERARLQRELDKNNREIISFQETLHKILDKSLNASFIIGEDKRILFTNPAVEPLFECKQKDLLNQTFKYEIVTGKILEAEIDCLEKGKRIAEMGALEIEWEGKPASLVSMRDITERKQMEKDLRASEEKYRNIVEIAQDGIITVDGLGRITASNQSFLNMVGYTSEEIIGKSFRELPIVDIKDLPKYEKLFASLMSGKTLRPIEISLRHRNGSIHTCEFRSSIMKENEKITGLQGIVIDITERKHTEEILRESEEKFSKAFQHSPEVILISSIEDGTIFEVNDTFLRMTGYNREEVIGKKTADLGIWADPQDRIKMVKTIKEKRIVSNREYRFRMKSGEIRTWLFSAEIINLRGQLRILSVATDITERKKMENKLRFSDIALRSIHEGVYAMDNDFKITHWNDMCEQMFGFKASEIVGKSLSGVFSVLEEYPGQNEKRFNLLIEKGFNKEEQRYKTSHGDMWVDVQAQAIEENGQRSGWITLVSDISERKKAEENLRFSVAAFKSIHDSVIATDLNHIVTHWNQMSEEIYGIKASEAIGKILSDLLEIEEDHPGDNERRSQQINTEGYCREDQRHRSRKGEVWVDVTVQVIEENGQRYGWVILASEITQRKLAEEALKQSEEKYRELINTSTDAIISADSQMKVTIWNRGAEKLFGYTEKEMLGKSVIEIVPEVTIKGMPSIYKEYTASRKIANQVIELVGIKKDGTEMPIELAVSTRKAGNVHIATAIIRDITQRKLAEEALKQSEEKYRELINTSNDTIISIDSQMKFILWNKGAEKLLDYTEEEMLGQSIMTIFPAEIQKDLAKELINIKKTGKSKEKNASFETKVMKKDCSLVPVDVSVSVRNSGEDLILTAIMRDITLRKEAEEKLRQIDQMKSEFLSNISHELRTPLQSISGFTKLIMDGQVPDPATQQEFLQIIDRETVHLGNLINGLLDMSRLEAGRFQIYRKPTAIRDIIIDSLKMFQSLARQKDIELSEKIPVEIPEMEVDNERMRQVIINLVSNAIKFSDPGTKVKVTVAIKNNELLFQVIDHGTGIREENMKNLFQRFYREEGETVRGGTGLGLYISRQIIEAHGGRIWAESEYGKGSTFSFSLPFNAKGGNNNGHKDTNH